MKVMHLDTPALLIDLDIATQNCIRMQEYANNQNVTLRPHTKTHKMPYLAHKQLEIGAKGIAVAKVGEAEVMAKSGISDIFIANEIVGEQKLKRIMQLNETINISFGIDSIAQVKMVESVFSNSKSAANVLIEIEVGEERSGVVTKETFKELLLHLKKCKHIHLKGIFSHDGHSYGAKNLEELKQIHFESQNRTLEFFDIAISMGFNIETVSIGSTPSLMHAFDILDGITEIRPGTYIFMDASQANAFGSKDRCAATVLATVMSKPTAERVILDVGAKGLTAQTRTKGLCATKGLGLIKGFDDISIFDVYDEHAIIYSKTFSESVEIGDKVEIIPNHICPVVNLHETACLIQGSIVVDEITVECRGKLK
jgi:D-serine deaminase-like pyridoxal phosphate-dependent protein